MKHRPCKYTKRRVSQTWGKLPLPALVQVMYYLTDSEKVMSAQVCRHWQIAFECPRLWRDREFEFGGSRFRPLGQKSVLYAKKFGKYLRHLKIICRQLTSHTCETMLGNLKAFLESLVESGPPVLHSLEIEDLELEFWRHGMLREEVENTLVQFFLTQNKLKTFRMPNAQFALKPFVNVLDAIADRNGESLRTLLIEFFFQSRPTEIQKDQFHNVMQNFTNLNSVELNYCCLSEDLVKTWATSLRGKLKEISIRCEENDPLSPVVPNSAWLLLKTACPCLLVDICIRGIGQSAAVVPFLAPALPLRTFKIFTGYDTGHELGLSEILDHVTSYFHQTLLILAMEFDNYHDDIDDALMRLVTRCKRLNFLKLKAQVDVQVARFICRLLEENRTSLGHVDLMLCDLSPNALENLNRLREDMTGFKQNSGVDLFLRDDLYPDAHWSSARTEPILLNADLYWEEQI